MPFFVDTAEDDGAYYLWADLPGVEKKDLRITTKEQTVTIVANRNRPGGAQQDTTKTVEVVDEGPLVDDAVDAVQDDATDTTPQLRPRRRERPFGMFRRQLTFPEDADLDGVTATVTAGVLQLTIPKRVVEQPGWREVPIA